MTHPISPAADDTRSWAILVPITLRRGPDHRGWRIVSIPDRIVLGAEAVPGHVEGPGIAPRHCGLAVTSSGLKAVDLCGQTRDSRGNPIGSSCILREGGVLRLGRVPVVVVRTREAQGRRWVGIGDLGSWSPAMVPVLAELALLASAAVPLLISGETGTGKELAARAVHLASDRRDRPWVAVNCGALHGELLIAELFGAEKGAYTGSSDKRKGAFERADGGTLLLDEVGELPLTAQAALLRVLETGEIQVLGGAARRVDVRVVCATHRDLHALVAEGRFRLDLLHRIEVAQLTLPPLRERPDDIVGLTAQWWPEAAADAQMLAALTAHAWPGNVRELRNCLQRLRLTAHAGEPDVIALAQLLTRHGQPVLASAVPRAVAGCHRGLAQLLHAGLSTADARRASGLPRSTFYRHLKAWRAAES